jgi:hypothetical protein
VDLLWAIGWGVCLQQGPGCQGRSVEDKIASFHAPMFA